MGAVKALVVFGQATTPNNSSGHSCVELGREKSSDPLFPQGQGSRR
jgi:hypothetical protein